MLIELHSTWEHFQARFPEWLNAVVLMTWGGYVVYHPGMFMDPRVNNLWKGLLLVAEQQTWGLAASLVGFARLTALYINGRHTRTPLVRLIASFFSAFVWTQVVIGMINSNVPNTGVIVYTGLVLADIYSAFRASADVTFVAKRTKAIKAELGRVANHPQRS